MAAWYLGSTKWTAVAAWAATTAYNVGDLRRQLATPTVGNERVFRCTTAGTSGGSEPAWTLTSGATTNDNTAVWTEVTGVSTYGWAAAHARLRNVLASGWAAAGDDIYVSQAHAATEDAAFVLTFPGTTASPNRLLCVNDAGSAPPVSADLTTGASESTGSGSARTMTPRGTAHIEGVIFRCGVGGSTASNFLAFNSATAGFLTFKNCLIELATTSASAIMSFGLASATIPVQGVRLINTPLKFAATQQTVVAYIPLEWLATPSAIQGSVPTTLFGPATAGGRRVTCIGVDLSALGSGKNWCSLTAGAPASEFFFQDCKAGASVTFASGAAAGVGGSTCKVVNCDSAATNYRYYSQNYQATETSETVVVRANGATADGATPVSRKVVTTANARFHAPYITDWMTFWNATTGTPITVAIPIITDNVTLTDAEIWIEVEGLGTASFPLGTFASDAAPDALNAGTAQTTDSTSVWTTTGLTTPVQQVLSTMFTAQMAGLVRARVCVAKASTTVYYGPAPIDGTWAKYGSAQYTIGADGMVQVGGVWTSADATRLSAIFAKLPVNAIGDETLLLAAVAGVQADTDNLQTRLPAALISGRIDASVGAYPGNTAQTGDNFARIGAAGAGLTALGDTRLANLDATISSRTKPADTQAAVTVVNGLASNAITAASIAATALNGKGDWGTAAQSATAVLTTAMTESYAADGVAPTLAQAMYLTMQRLTEFAISGTSITIKKLDGATSAAVLTMDSATAPTSSTRTL